MYGSSENDCQSRPKRVSILINRKIVRKIFTIFDIFTWPQGKHTYDGPRVELLSIYKKKKKLINVKSKQLYKYNFEKRQDVLTTPSHTRNR